jgi:hypothetical protein
VSGQFVHLEETRQQAEYSIAAKGSNPQMPSQILV